MLFNLERYACVVMGLTIYGVHFTAYVSAPEEEGGIKFWVSRRSENTPAFPGMLDNTAAGGIKSGETPTYSAGREAYEEASLSKDHISKMKAVGTISYFGKTDHAGDQRLLQAVVEFLYECELPADVTPKPHDDEASNFELFTVDQLRTALEDGEFKPGYEPVAIDFLVRHGIIHEGNEKDYAEIVSRLHRKLEFPLMPGKTVAHL